MYQFIRAKNNEKHSCIKNIHIKVVSCTNHLISLSYLWNKLVSLFTKNWLLHLKNYPIPIHIKIKVIIICLHFKYNNYISSFGLGKKNHSFTNQTKTKLSIWNKTIQTKILCSLPAEIQQSHWNSSSTFLNRETKGECLGQTTNINHVPICVRDIK